MNTLESSRRERRTEATRRRISPRTDDEVVYEFDPDNPPPMTPEQRAEIESLARMPDSAIDYSDIPRQSREEWEKKIVIGNPWITPPTKTVLDGFLIDSDIIYWIVKQVGEDGYMDKMNAMLRRAMNEERAEAAP